MTETQAFPISNGMRVSTKRILSIGVAVLLLIAALIVYSALIQPESDVIKEKRALVASKANLYDNQREAVQEVKKLIAEFQNIKQLEEMISLAMPEGEEVVGALRQIESMAAFAGVIITGLDFQASMSRAATEPFIKRLGTLEVSIGLTGDYANLKQFLRYVETSVRLASVTALDLTPAGPRGSSDALSIKVNMFYQE